MRTSLSSLVLRALFLPLAAAGLGAQNLVVNGDFEGGTNSSGDPNGWLVSGYTVAAMVSKFDTTGGGATNSYNHHPGGKTYPNTGVNAIEQDVLLVQGVVHEFRADIASVAVGGNADGGTVEVFVDGVSIGKHAFGSIASNATERTRLCLRAVPTTSGKKRLKITFFRRYVTHTGTPTVHIDNIFFGRTAGPTLCFVGERKAGGMTKVSVLGAAKARFGIFISPKNTTPYPIPPWSGQWELAAPFFPLVIADLDANGQWSLAVTVPASAKGIKAWFQGIQGPPTSAVLAMGFGQEVNVY